MVQTKAHVKVLLICISELAIFVAWKYNVLFENIYDSKIEPNKWVPNDETMQAKGSKLLIEYWEKLNGIINYNVCYSIVSFVSYDLVSLKAQCS